MAGRRRSRAEWEKLVAEALRTGDLGRVAARHGVAVKQLSWWKWTLSRESSAGSTPSGGQLARQSAPRLLPVVIEAPTSEVPTIDVCVRDVTIRVRPGAPTVYVAELVEAIRRC